MSGLLSYAMFFATLSTIFAIATIGLNLQWGLCGQFNAGVVGFIGVGAYTQALLTVAATPEHAGGVGLPFPLALLASMAATGLVAVAIGLTTIRLRTDYLALATFGIAATLQLCMMNLDPLTGGGRGIPGIPRPFGWLPPLPFGGAFLALAVAIATVIYVATETAVRSPWGRALRAIRDDEVAAASLGKPVARLRLTAFVFGSVLMGLSGALYASFIGYVSPFDFLAIVTFQIWAMLIVGGAGRSLGAVLGAFLVWGLWSLSGVAVVFLVPTRFQTQGGAIQAILIGCLLVAFLILKPQGLIGERTAGRVGRPNAVERSSEPATR